MSHTSRFSFFQVVLLGVAGNRSEQNDADSAEEDVHGNASNKTILSASRDVNPVVGEAN